MASDFSDSMKFDKDIILEADDIAKLPYTNEWSNQKTTVSKNVVSFDNTTDSKIAFILPQAIDLDKYTVNLNFTVTDAEKYLIITSNLTSDSNSNEYTKYAERTGKEETVSFNETNTGTLKTISFQSHGDDTLTKSATLTLSKI